MPKRHENITITISKNLSRQNTQLNTLLNHQKWKCRVAQYQIKTSQLQIKVKKTLKLLVTLNRWTKEVMQGAPEMLT